MRGRGITIAKWGVIVDLNGHTITGLGTQVNRNHAGCNGGMGIASPVLVTSDENWAGGNGDNLGCDGVVCRLSLSCGTD